MSTAHIHAFRHRQNQDGSFDSICLTCYLTVGSRLSEGELEGAETAHRCSEIPGAASGESSVGHLVPAQTAG